MPRIPDAEFSAPIDTRYALVTVGTTKFDSLINTLSEQAKLFLTSCHALNITTILLQIGNSSIEPEALDIAAAELLAQSIITSPISIQWCSYASNFPTLIQNAALLVSHAGAGSIIEALRSPRNASPETRVRLFVVVNDALMDNHQEALAEAFAKQHYLYYAAKPQQCVDILSRCDWEQIIPYPAPNTLPFVQLVAQTMAMTQPTHVPIVEDPHDKKHE